jgi:hypothetical protein
MIKKLQKSYHESQKFNYTWAWLVLLFSSCLTFALIGLGIENNILSGEEFGTIPITDIAIIILFSSLIIFHIGFLIFLLFSKLTIHIDSVGVHFCFFPFHQSMQTLTWDMIYKFHLRDYNANQEYGGHGIKYGRMGSCYTVKGKVGLQLYLKNGKEILIGTQDPGKLANHLDTIKKELSSTTYFIKSVLEK